jgi:hypothetical protein
MKNLNELTLAKLTSAEAYKRHIQTVRRNAAIERQRVEVQADLARLQALYTEGAGRKEPVVDKPQFTEAKGYTVVKLPGGLEASKAAEKGARTRRERSTRVLDMSPEAVQKREARRARRAARKARKAATAN